MPETKRWSRLLWVGFTAMALAGCGVLPMAARHTTAAALAPFTTAAQAVGTDMQILGRGFAALSSRTATSNRQITTAISHSPMPTRAVAAPVQPRPVSYQRPRSTGARENPAKEVNKSAALDILPREVLTRLTPDQAGLQRAAQNAAATAVVGETIFWHLDGREGTAMAETESLIGGFTCRTFVQTLALEDTFEKVSVKACHTPGGTWTQSF